MDLLTVLTPAESDRLWWRIIRALAAVSDEIDCLKLAPGHVRDALYGAGCLDSYEYLLSDLADLADNDFDRPRSIWAVLLDDTPEKGTTQWHDSEDPTPPAMTARFFLLLRQQARRSARRLMSPWQR